MRQLIIKANYCNNKNKCGRTEQKEKNKGKSSLQTNHMAVGVTSNMKPSTRINQCWVPALKHVVGVRKLAPHSMQSTPYTAKSHIMLKHNFCTQSNYGSQKKEIGNFTSTTCIKKQ